MFGEKENVVEYRSRRGVDRGHRMLGDIEARNMDRWADDVLRTYHNSAVPCTPKNPSHTEATDTRSSITTSDTGGLRTADDRIVACSNPLAGPSVQAHYDYAPSHHGPPHPNLEQTLGLLLAVVAFSAPNQTSAEDNLLDPSHRDTALPSQITQALGALTSHIEVQSVTLQRDQIDPEHLAVVNLGDEEFAFDRRTVPPRPAIAFSNDLPRLFREWHSSDCSNALVVNGRGIPVKYWPAIFKKRAGHGTDTWSSTRGIWGKWKSIVQEREKFTSDDAFWAVYRDVDGNRLCYQHLLDKLQKQRMEADARDAANAREFFRGDLDSPAASGAFRYYKGSSYRVCTKDQQVAERWRSLLETDAQIAECWHATQMEGGEMEGLGIG
ncbi:hypothetical protein GLOTRDRAFT_128037 [Gloeophyllum trabeum ATCC 11539]|uniref:Uncharacterized protein n=1 Tax=Gloeophyllum trabeum (strain ATCC 11539 / FP-39264 / Madison 617) TaxID=670483 RepID=S7RSQ7_GLOTA|nr:uncharacterized protein GLOTRDRAFT_128037 [Gloeophyllum trabeum ATCC 11539]EPQ56079.1 hypothetical protein GLOTRDRAFT_128037 [Gloeophyllum trabeum ATCC 11539]